MIRRAKTERIITTGKGSRELRKEVIPALRKEILALKKALRSKEKQAEKYKVANKQNEHIVEKLDNRLSRVRKTRMKIIRRRDALRTKIQRITNGEPVLSSSAKLKRHCEAYYEDKVFDTKSTPSFFAAFLGFGYIKHWIRDNGYSERELFLIVVMYHHKWFIMRDSVRWGFRSSHFLKCMKRFREDGLVYTYSGSNRAKNYVLTEKAKQMIFSYEAIYNKHVEKLLKNRPDNTPILKLTVTSSWKDQL